MKKLILPLLLVLVNSVFSQTISPSINSEQCPFSLTTFTVTVPRIKDNTTPVATGINGALVTTQITQQSLTHTTTNTYATFVGVFGDINRNQTFKITYEPENSSSTVEYNANYKKIKSLLIYTPYSNIQPNISSIASEICQITTHNISFSNIQFGNADDLGIGGYGSITSYEYLLPAGWKLGSTTSDGSTWITGSNNETVTSDLTTGSGLSVKIRGINTSCGSGLVKGIIKEIPITRPDPQLSISGATQLCYPNSYNYTVNGVPSGAVVTWNTNSYYTISGSGNSVTITPTSAANGGTNIGVTVYLPVCGRSYSTSLYVSIGVPTATFSITSYPSSEPSCYEPWGIYSYQAQQITGFPYTYTNTQWGWRNLTLSTSYTDPTIYGLSYTFIPEAAGTYEIWVKPTNSCGVGTTESIKTITVVESCSGGFMMSGSTESSLSIYPNPTRSTSKVKVPKQLKKDAILYVSDQFGILLLSRRIPNDSELIDIDLSKYKKGFYQVTLRSGKISVQGKIIKQ